MARVLEIMNTAAFKDCDIRGTYPDQVNEDIFLRVGRVFGRRLAETTPDAAAGDTVVVAGDGRHSTPALLAALIEGLSTAPVDIVTLGTGVPTPAVYWYKDHFDARASAIITASHNPPHWNGLKVMNGDRPPRPEDIGELAHMAGAEDTAAAPAAPGRARAVEAVTDRYRQAMLADFSHVSLKGLRIVVDPGNGCLSGVVSATLRALGADVIALHDRLDGSFPERNPDCAVAENLAELVATVVDRGADFGVAFDGDGDRIAVVDDKGRVLGAERLAMLLFQGAVKVDAGDAVILDVKCSTHLERAVRLRGGTPVRCKSGHAYMKRQVLEWAAVAGVELSGHIFLGAIKGRDDPLHVSLLLAGWLAGQNRKLSAFVDALPEMFMTDDIRVAMEKKEIDGLLDACAKGYGDAEVQSVDGVRLVWPDGWLLVRRSITEPKVTIRLEGDSEAGLNRIGNAFAARFPALAVSIEEALVKGRK